MLQYEIVCDMAIEFIINILRVALIKQAIETFLTRGDKDERIFKSAYGIFYLVSSAVYCAWGVSWPYEICSFAGILGITCCYGDTWKKRLWTATTLFGMDLACLSVAIFSFGRNAYGASLYMETAAGVLLLLISVTAISHIFDPDDFRYAVFDKKQTLLLSVTPVAGVIVLFSMLYTKTGYTKTAAIVCVCMLVSNLSIFYLYHEMLRSYVHIRERDIYKQQTELYRNQMEVITESQSRIRALRHDMKNHMLALQAVAGNGSKEEVQEYLRKMQEFMVNPDESVMTGNENIDSVLNYKIRKARELLNAVETRISIPEKLNLNSFDLNVVLGNLLDNALEAAAQTEEKELSIQMSAEKGMMFLEIGNSYNEKFSGKKGIGKTTKTDKSRHGIGMKNVQAIIEKYHGDMEITCDGRHFEVDVMLYMKDL
ncbi:MAG: sensor histidine kinase [Roseburia sp.]|nr:sensor histidine kinase [Roseburia sp.]